MFVDTGIITSMTFATAQSGTVTKLYERNPLWEAPFIWRSGFLGALALHYRRGLVNYDESLEALRFAERLIGKREHQVPARAIVDAVVRSGCLAHECEFVVLAERLGTPLVTYAERILKDFPHVAITPEQYLTTA